jgi:hypothetical protein
LEPEGLKDLLPQEEVQREIKNIVDELKWNENPPVDQKMPVD